MKKLFFTMMLAIVSNGLLMANETICVPESPDALYQDWTSVSGTIQDLTYPCVEGEDCPGCLAWAIVTEDKTYYLSTRNNSVRNFLEQINDKAIPAIYLLPLKATASGIPYQKGEYNFIAVNSINGLSVEYFGSPTDRIPSLCDEWHMLTEPWNCAEPSCYLSTTIFRATTDTIINHVFYRKLEYTDESPLYGTRVIYKGALREGDNSDIYYIPANSEHEYLMYAFNAHVGDTLENLWIGGVPEECPNGYVGVVTGISDGEQPEYTILGVENERGEITWVSEWVKGVGFKDNPTGPLFYLNAAIDYGVETILCAYKDGQQVYASSKSEKFGCTYNGLEPTKPYFLCDEWNVLEVKNESGDEVYETHKVRLAGDTILTLPGGDFPRGVKVEQDGQYVGTMRTGNKHDVYYIPAGSTHEYLLYNFDAKVGGSLSNLWCGGRWEEYPNGLSGIIKEISDSNPRVFTIELEYYLPYGFTDGTFPYTIYWIDGVGMPNGPISQECPYFCEQQQVLCAYKNGEQIYTSELGEKLGCNYFGIPNLLGTWQVYKEELTGNDYNEQGELVELTRTKDDIDDLFWVIKDSVMYLSCPTCYSAPMHYTVEYARSPYFRIIIPGRFDTIDISTPAVKDNGSPIEGRFMSETEIEWGYSLYGGDEGPITYHQYLRKVSSIPAPSDTVPLYIKDGPGTSPVEPVDPNQIVATLVGDMLSIYEYIGAEIGYKLTKAPTGNNMPARGKEMADDTFSESVSIQLTERGLYTLELTNPEWGYTIVGTFEYDGMQGIEPVETGVPAAQKILRNGQLLIRKGDRIYTVQGIELRE